MQEGGGGRGTRSMVAERGAESAKASPTAKLDSGGGGGGGGGLLLAQVDDAQ